MVDYLHGHHESVLRSHRSRTAANSAGYLLPVLEPGFRLLDVGSGPGTITADLARLVAEVVAVEPSADALALTETEVARQELGNVRTEVADVHALQYPDDSFDVAHAHQVLQHVQDPVRALREMARVVRPGGWIAVRDSDYSGFVWHPRVPALDHWLDLYRELARGTGGEPDAGRWLPTWADEAGLRDVRFSSTSWCYSTGAERAWWAGLWAERAVASTFAQQAMAAGVSLTELEGLADGWRDWGAAPTGLFLVPSVELLARV